MSMTIRKILIFKSGLLGDTLVALPALHCLKNAYPDSSITYVWQKYSGKAYVTPMDVLCGAGLIDEFYCYEMTGSTVNTILGYCKLFFYLCGGRFDLGVILEAPFWSTRRKSFLHACGIRVVIGPDGDEEKVYQDEFGKLPRAPKIADSLMALLKPLNIDIPAQGKGNFDIALSIYEKDKARNWLINNTLSHSQLKIFIAVAPGSNMSSKRWNLDNYYKVIDQLIEKYNVLPIVLGGINDRACADYLINKWSRGINAAGEVTIREGVAILSLCDLYLGNDTGTMHMAVSAGIPCVAVFSSIDMPGRWEPYGDGHYVFRTDVECAGCLLRECNKGDEHCINQVPFERVYEKCSVILDVCG